MDAVKQLYEQNPYLCGFPLVTSKNHHLFNKVFVRENIRCRVPIQPQYFNELVKKYVFPLLCPICGTAENLETNQPNVDGFKTQAMCPICVAKLELKKCNGGVQRIQHRNSMKRHCSGRIERN